MLATPRKFTLVASGAEGPSRLNAFDNALLKAGIGNVNLIRVSSILPPNSTEVTKLSIAPGSLLPTAYGAIQSEVEGEWISAAVGIGIGDPSEYGVIMEFSGRCRKGEAEDAVLQMLKDAFVARDRSLQKHWVLGAEHQVKNIGCAFAAVALWY